MKGLGQANLNLHFMQEKVYTFSSTHQASRSLLPQYLKRVMGYYKMLTLLKVQNGRFIPDIQEIVYI